MAIQFKINSQKAIECLLWIIQRGQSNMYNIWKILFAAEKYHLNKYGRPITGDNYIAMKHGTVPSMLYEKIKDNNLRGIVKSENTLYAEREPITDFFSKSDIKALEYGYKEYANLDFNEVEDKNHKELAWIKNYNNRGNNKCAPIPFEDLIEEDWLKEDLEIAAQTMVL